MVAVAGEAGQLELGPCLWGFRFRAGFGLTHGTQGIAGPAVDLALDVIMIGDPVQRRAGDLGFGSGVDVEEVAAQMGPTPQAAVALAA